MYEPIENLISVQRIYHFYKSYKQIKYKGPTTKDVWKQ